jgi:hypothetical protein
LDQLPGSQPPDLRPVLFQQAQVDVLSDIVALPAVEQRRIQSERLSVVGDIEVSRPGSAQPVRQVHDPRRRTAQFLPGARDAAV